MRTLLVLLALTPLLLGTTCRFSSSDTKTAVVVCNSTSSSGGCAPKQDPDPPESGNTGLLAKSGTSAAALWPVATTGIAFERPSRRTVSAIPEPSASLAFAAGCLVIAIHLRGARMRPR